MEQTKRLPEPGFPAWLVFPDVTADILRQEHLAERRSRRRQRLAAQRGPRARLVSNSSDVRRKPT
jgi:hypothetical protein